MVDCLCGKLFAKVSASHMKSTNDHIRLTIRIAILKPRVQIIFDTYGKLTGAQIKTFLLEKVRVVKHSAMERNYHIFYMLAAGASTEEKECWALSDLKSHQLTSQSGCYDRRDGVLDADLYEELIGAFKVMGFEEEEKANIFRMVAAILALGDVDFVERADAGDGETLTDLAENSRPRLEAAARLLDVAPENILSALTSRKINAGISNQVGALFSRGGCIMGSK